MQHLLNATHNEFAFAATAGKPTVISQNVAPPLSRLKHSLFYACDIRRLPNCLPIILLPLNRPRRLRGHVVNDAIDALHLVDDPRRHRADEFHVERIKIRGHAVGRGHRAQADDVGAEILP